MQTLRSWPILVALLSTLAFPATAVEIDGRIDPADWADARHVTDFRLTQPLSRAPAPQATEAWILSTPEGLAIGFRNTQAPDIPRTRQRNQRDNVGPQDRVNLYVDFDGDGRAGYNFVVALGGGIRDSTVTNENLFNPEWDGNWRHAVSEDDAGWSAEMLIPWYIAPMRDGNNGTRTLGINLDRVIGATGERVSWPANTFTEARFVSEFARVQVPAYSQSLLAITPYVVGIHDALGEHNDLDAGVDLFWKPNGRFQLSATLNPDFGQVESDELGINFGANETFFSDKRPFFTENQGFFDVPLGALGSSNRLIYTRRVGASADDGSGPADVSAAAKLNGSLGGINYGLFSASESGAAGRYFHALRATHDFARQGVGATLTRVSRPFLDRTADVAELDHRWIPNEALAVRTTLVTSDVDEPGRVALGHGRGAMVRVEQTLDDRWRQRLYVEHLGADLQINDFGFLGRNDFNFVRYDLIRRDVDLPESSPYRTRERRWAAAHRTNDSGVQLGSTATFTRRGDRRDGGNDLAEINAWTSGHDDLILRGNGVVKMPARLYAFYERFRPLQGDSPWVFFGRVNYAAEGLDGPGRGKLSLLARPTYQASDRLSFFAGLELSHNPDWLLWRGDNLLGSFRSDATTLNAGADWLIDDRQELRVRMEAIGADAHARESHRVGDDRRPVTVDEQLADFGVRKFGLQVRYRYEFAPLSYLYVAYVRGGSLLSEGMHGFDSRHEFGEAMELRDSERFLVKLNYRFHI